MVSSCLLRTTLLAALAAGNVPTTSVAQMVHGSAVPSWAPTYQMNRSTFLMACNNTGLFNPEFGTKWGIVDYDWSNMRFGDKGWTSSVPMDCQEKLTTQAAATKAVDNETKVFVYRNMVKALPWYTSVREKIVDPAYSGFFLRFKCNKTASDPKVHCKGVGPKTGGCPDQWGVGCHVPTQGSLLYHDQEQTSHGSQCPANMTGPSPCCGVPCGEYLFDHRNGSMLQQWFIEEFVGGPDGIDSPHIDGFFFDDNYGSRSGASEEDPYNIEDCGLTPTEAAAVSKGWQDNTAAVGAAVLQKGGFAVPFFEGAGRNITDPKSTCKADLARLCKVNTTTNRPNIHDQALMLEFSRIAPGQAPPGWLWHLNGSLPYFEQDLATFLLARGKYAWIGYVWSGCTDSGYPAGCKHDCEAADCKPCRFPLQRDAAPFPRPAALDLDYGEPVSNSHCQETSPGSGVYTREWTKASVSLDCNSFTAKIEMK